MARATRRTEANECRRCSAFCDRVIEPAACVAAGCSALYSYDDPLNGRRYMGCAHKVFECEIDTELFEAAQRTRAGYGAVKLTGIPRAVCDFAIEQAFDGRLADGLCVNRRFWDWPDSAPGALRAFDLRDGLSPA